jgi:hypothetical protein
MYDFSEVAIAAQRVQSLAWQEDHLIDWAGRHVIFHSNGTSERVYTSYGRCFDSAAVSPSGECAVIYERLGTKGLIIRNGQLLREINRSYYCSDVYEYPVALFALPDGREVIAHCPDEYCKIEIEELISGKRLTQRANKPQDFFHSRN